MERIEHYSGLREPVFSFCEQLPNSEPLWGRLDMGRWVGVRFFWEERFRQITGSTSPRWDKRFVSIHPYKDGNGRIARLIMNTVLIQDGYLVAVIPPVLRREYIELLEKAHRDDKPFELFIAERILESEKEVMRLLHMPIPKLNEK